MTFDELAELEPALTPLEVDARSKYPSVCDGCELDIWYGEFKPRLVKLIGFDREADSNQQLMSCDAYDTATRHLLKCINGHWGTCSKCGAVKHVICKHCNRSMTEALSCVCVDVPTKTGRLFNPIPWDGNEHDEKCHDCGVTAGGFHHPGCDMEQCPQCSGQIISCGCLQVRAKSPTVS